MRVVLTGTTLRSLAAPGAEGCSRVLRRNFNGLVTVSAFENVEARDLKGLLGHRSVVDGQLALSNAQRLRLGDRGEDVPCEAHAAGVHLVTPRGYGGRDGRPLLRVELHAGVTVRNEHELHRGLLDRVVQRV